ncbi:asparaginase [Microbacterium candidum]|uniref:asparaginase n=1 Tax=Microbacterium candidum TaxID=3041922 RepID=A0ABT7MVD6_9MICO|nr:asparaginase [Microbacterium sp. ASV49]MDL9978414.1 asparaginase [Microbacterium sp. ASV49]
MAHIVVLATGGTISSRSGAAGSVATDGAVALLGAALDSSQASTVEAVDVLRKNSFNITLADVRTLAEAIRTQLDRADVDGVVVTHGTDTVEECAFLVDLVHDDPRPVVFTGAQLSADRPDSDGPANLRDAIAVASAPAARSLGVLLTFAGRIFGSRGVQKADTLAPDPFSSRDGGPIGRVICGVVHLTARPARTSVLPMPGPTFGDVPVEILHCHLGSGDHAFRRAVESGARGIVLAGTGAGNLNTDLVAAVADAVAAGVVVALGTRVSQGPVVPLYGGGGAVDALAAGAVSLGTLSCVQGRILLALLLEHHTPRRAAELLSEYCAAV